MKLSAALKKAYTEERLTAREAQQRAEWIAWAPAVFQASRAMVKMGILDLLRDSPDGLTRQEICRAAGISDYAAKCLLEASLSIGTVLIDTDTDRYTLSKTGWCLLTDPMARVNMDFCHDVNYEGWFRLEDALKSGRPEGLRHFGHWPTVYEGLAELPPQAQKSWFAFDHFYSDAAFPKALKIIFDEYHVQTLYDVGGNTGKWALQCVAYSPEAHVTILDLPQQIEMMRRNIEGHEGASRISGHAIDLLDPGATFPPCRQNDTHDNGGVGEAPDAIWMSQFLDCFSMEQIVSILGKARERMDAHTRMFIMETLWDRQRYDTAAFCLTMTSLYFTAIANGNSKMYNTEDMQDCIAQAALTTERIYDGLGMGHSVIVVRKEE